MLRIFILLTACLCAAQVAIAIEPDCLIDSDPELQIPDPVRNFNPALKTLWLAALDRPEIDMQRMAAETIARAHRYGIPDLIEAVPRLEKILEADASHPAVRYAAARALIVLESQSTSEKLWNASQRFGSDLRQLIEPALARWDFGPARAVWIRRLDDSETRRRDLLLAMRGLAQVRDQEALPRLLSLAQDPLRDSVVRLEAAMAAGQSAETELEPEADRLAQNTRSPLFVNQLCAIRLLARHDSDAARQLLISLAGDVEPTVAAAALHRLNEIDPALVVPLAESAMKNADPHVRAQGATAYLKLPAVERIAPLCQLLDDAHPSVRRQVGDGLLQLAENSELIEPIHEAALRILNGDRWQGQEQAALLLGALEYKPAANRFVELLESPRVEVMVASAWALRKVAVPETIPALIDKASRQTERRIQVDEQGLDDQVVHLFEALGVLKSADAAPLLKQYVPKRPILGERSRGAAIWAIGRLMEGTRNPELENAISDRINDFDDKPQESLLVKQMCAISLARMDASELAPMMRGMATASGQPIRLEAALRWAVKELSGEELPPPKALTVSQGNWFLEPYP